MNFIKKSLISTLVGSFLASIVMTVPVAAAGVTLQYGMTKDPNIRLLQRYLDCSKRADFLNTSAYTSNFYSTTQTGLKNWQKAAGYKVTGKVTVGSTQWTKLKAEATAQRCVGSKDIDSRSYAASKTRGIAIDVSKFDRKLRLIKNGKVVMTADTRFGDSGGYFTREGTFKVYWKSRDHVSREYAGAHMPFAMFFDGGQAIHYSQSFADIGYAGNSKGCVNLRSIDRATLLFDATPVGTQVIVH